jgi:endonuclease/exonuclease/phosphatase family metal-dependent hydrolase
VFFTRSVFVITALFAFSCCASENPCGPIELYGESRTVNNSKTSENRTNLIRVMSFNIRYDNPDDGPNAWPYRKDIAASMIRFHRADSAGLQEANRRQTGDLAERLPEYAWFGLGRDDGKDAGEFMTIFYRKDRLELLDQNTFWLSETPGVPGSRSWGTSAPRTVAWGRFRDRETGRTFFHFNTHFDVHSAAARLESAKLLVRRIAETAGDLPAILTGDLNCREADPPYEILVSGDGIPENALTDAMKASIHGHHGPTGTMSGFEKPGTPGRRIDFIFVKNAVTVLQHGILADSFDGRYPSDHLPVLAEITID